jgi:hypothetical protein
MNSDSILTVGSIAIDWLEMPDGTEGEVLGGSATYFVLAASQFAPVHIVGVVGSDFPQEGHDLFKTHAANLDDLQVVEGKTFRWGGRYHKNWENRTTLFTELGVFGDFKPTISQGNRSCPLVFLANYSAVPPARCAEPNRVTTSRYNRYHESVDRYRLE